MKVRVTTLGEFMGSGVKSDPQRGNMSEKTDELMAFLSDEIKFYEGCLASAMLPGSREWHKNHLDNLTALRRIVAREGKVTELVEAVTEDIAARFPYLTPDIPTVRAAEERMTKAKNSVIKALAALREG
jgi:hypothetical protein